MFWIGLESLECWRHAHPPPWPTTHVLSLAHPLHLSFLPSNIHQPWQWTSLFLPPHHPSNLIELTGKTETKMPDPAQINRSISTIKTELEYLVSSGVLSPPQLQSIQAQLPVCISSQQDTDRREQKERNWRKEGKNILTTLATKRPTLTIHRSQIRKRQQSIQSRAHCATSAGSATSGEPESSKGR